MGRYAQILTRGRKIRQIWQGRLCAASPKRQLDCCIRYDEKISQMEARIGIRSRQGILDELPQHFRGSHLRRSQDYKYLLEVHGPQKVMIWQLISNKYCTNIITIIGLSCAFLRFVCAQTNILCILLIWLLLREGECFCPEAGLRVTLFWGIKRWLFFHQDVCYLNEVWRSLKRVKCFSRVQKP